MKHVHPNLKLAAAFAAIALLSNAGCRNQQSTGLANPFIAPNRVPPPSTRALLPGQAQPYYSGDPLPVTQKAAGQSGAVALASTEAEMPSADGNLAWTSPSGAAPTSDAGPAPTINPLVSSPPSAALVASNEPTVAIPDDGNSLRFALPTAAPTEPQPFTPSGPVASASSQAPTSAPPTLQLPAPPSSRDILQAAYTEPVITNSEAPSPSPWLTPQIAQSSAAPSTYYEPQQLAAQPVGLPLASNTRPSLPTYSMPTVAAANTMEVRMREVPSPPMPRIRIPGYDTSVLTVGSADGFRPRTSMR